jgi:hypothetical protein
MNLRRIALIFLSAIMLSACVASKDGIPQGKTKVGNALITTPKDRDSYEEIMVNEVVPAVKGNQITPEEARTFLREQKKKLGVGNPETTNGFDKLIAE